MSVRSIVPLVLHRVISGMPEHFEDVTIPLLEMILNKIGEDWVSIQVGEDSLPGKADRGWLLTFDDGNSSDYEFVFPRLQARNQQACFFLVTEHIGKSGFMSWEQVREMQRYGMVFGSHSVSHRNMTGMSPDEVKRELSVSRACIEEHLGEKVQAFSFPFGNYTPGLVREVWKEGFQICCTSDHGVCQSPFGVVPRNSINGSMDRTRVEKTLDASMWTRCIWRTEDASKKMAKRCLSEGRYKKLRSLLTAR